MRNTILTLICLALCAGAGADGDWTPLDPANAPQARSGHTLTLFPDGQVRLFGGENNLGELFNDLAVFNGTEWIAEEPVNAPPPPRVNHVAWSMDGKLFVHQGLGTGKTVLGDFWSYDPSTKEWSKIESAGNPTPRFGHVALPQKDRLVMLVGGRSQNGKLLTDVWMVDGGYNQVEFDTLPSGFDPHGGMRVDTMSYVVGQGGELYSYYPTKRLWTSLPRLSKTAGYFSSATTQDEEGKSFLHVFGGYDETGQESRLVHDYDVAASSWKQREQNMPAPLVDSKCVALPARGGSSILHFGGESNGVLTNQTLLFTPDGGTPPPPPPAKGFANQIGALGNGQFSVLAVCFPETQSEIQIDIEWTGANSDLDLRILAIGCPNKCEALRDAEEWMRFAARQIAEHPWKASGKAGKSDRSGNSRSETLSDVDMFVAFVCHRRKTQPARDIQLRMSKNENAPCKVRYLFPVGAQQKNDPAKTHFVRLPLEPVRWHSRIPWGAVGDETVVPGSEWQWNFVDRTPHMWYFFPLPGFVEFTLP